MLLVMQVRTRGMCVSSYFCQDVVHEVILHIVQNVFNAP